MAVWKADPLAVVSGSYAVRGIVWRICERRTSLVAMYGRSSRLATGLDGQKHDDKLDNSIYWIVKNISCY